MPRIQDLSGKLLGDDRRGFLSLSVYCFRMSSAFMLRRCFMAASNSQYAKAPNTHNIQNTYQ
jgi:hypothetical protein